jgi:pyruvate dehydrogenase E2 component (dihydrolipoamide acetyltransferase)
VSASAGSRGEVEIEEPTAAQRAIARRAAESRATIPQLELTAEVGMEGCLRLLESGRCSRLALIVLACAAALREQPRANAAYRDGRFERYSRINIGIVVPTRDGFAMPAVLDADRLGLDVLEERVSRLASRAAAGELAAPDLAGATFSVSELNEPAVTSSAPLIVPGHGAALCAGPVRRTPVARDGGVALGDVCTLTLACDHRILYGRAAAALLAAIARNLEQPAP